MLPGAQAIFDQAVKDIKTLNIEQFRIAYLGKEENFPNSWRR